MFHNNKELSSFDYGVARDDEGKTTVNISVIQEQSAVNPNNGDDVKMIEQQKNKSCAFLGTAFGDKFVSELLEFRDDLKKMANVDKNAAAKPIIQQFERCEVLPLKQINYEVLTIYEQMLKYSYLALKVSNNSTEFKNTMQKWLKDMKVEYNGMMLTYSSFLLGMHNCDDVLHLRTQDQIDELVMLSFLIRDKKIAKWCAGDQLNKLKSNSFKLHVNNTYNVTRSEHMTWMLTIFYNGLHIEFIEGENEHFCFFNRAAACHPQLAIELCYHVWVCLTTNGKNDMGSFLKHSLQTWHTVT